MGRLLPDYFFYAFKLSVLRFKPIDHKIHPKFNWTRAAASGLSLSLITNYKRSTETTHTVASSADFIILDRQISQFMQTLHRKHIEFPFLTDAD